jgi:ribosomal protein S12 methylthiotransferase
LVEFIDEARFERLGVFPYSQEDRTAAAGFEGQVPARVKKQRYQRAMARQQQVSREVQQGFVGQTVRVLVEQRTARGFKGRTHADAPQIDGIVSLTGTAKVGEFATVRITGASAYDLTGRII